MSVFYVKTAKICRPPVAPLPLPNPGGTLLRAPPLRKFLRTPLLIVAHFFIEKGCAVITDNAKIFSQLMSKNRSLAKISEKRLQPLLV